MMPFPPVSILATFTDGPATRRRASWRELGGRARAWRILHASWSVAQLACLGLIWQRVLTRRRDRALWASVGFLTVEGAALVIGRGDCPMGGLQEEWGDPVPFFELVLPPRAAKAAVPVLALISATAIAGVVLCSPGLAHHTLTTPPAR
jgi:hypothetical protein